MSEIYISYSGASGFKRANDKGSLGGKVVSYADFKGLSGDIKPGSSDEYGIILDSKDVQEFIANYEEESIFTDAEKA
ncbi:MAG: hypothetical protein IJM22_06385 [Treponema sp.]|uniref:hypothetical protein n=1 Tax=Treponema sp. TaxID=166 RepID=UPI00298D7FFB|nr:hypothetical protein [Treponema sp.]MBR0155686.1 hypothetical protein [Treponema sp.]MCR5386332.1 hypothetical protein [Treponema sp.]